jgi:hemerythrin-like domain-containing protein
MVDGVICMAQEILQRPPPGLEKAMEKISPTEELCVEHAMIDRVLLAIDKTLKMAGNSKKADLSPINKGCELIKMALVQHHMKIEEEHIYPRFEDDRVLGQLARELKDQHIEARKMVSRMDQLSRSGSSDTDELRRVFMDFRDMMTAHDAREATVLFPAMEGIWTDKQLQSLKEAQEEDEEKLLGEEGEEKLYSMLGEVESAAGIESVKDFTRRLK